MCGCGGGGGAERQLLRGAWFEGQGEENDQDNSLKHVYFWKNHIHNTQHLMLSLNADWKEEFR